MALFKQGIVYRGLDFDEFDKHDFELYTSKQKRKCFTLCFEYINKLNLNSKLTVVGQKDKSGKVHYYIITDKDELIATDMDAYARQRYNCDGIKFVTDHDICMDWGYDIDVKKANKFIDAVYNVNRLYEMEGKHYANVRRDYNYFQNHYGETIFRDYGTNPADKDGVLRLYDLWKEQSRARGNSFIVDAKIFKDGLENDYNHKYILQTSSGKIIGFISFTMFGDYAFVYSTKGDKDYRGLYTKLIHELCFVLKDRGITRFNFGSIDDPGNPADYKEFLKPTEYITYYSNAKESE